MALTAGEILFISWCAPGLVRPRSVQVARTAKALTALGWQVELIRADYRMAPEFELVDRELEDFYREVFWRNHALRDPEYTRVDEDAESQTIGWMRWFASRNASLPSWVEAATHLSQQRLRGKRRPIFISFAQPWSCHEVGRRLKEARPDGIWLAHFSDPWADSPFFSHLPPDDLAEVLGQERAVIENADRLIFVTERTRELVMAKYPPQDGKAHAIPHAMDADLLHALGSERPWFDTAKLNLVHVGSVYDGTRMHEGLLQALEMLSVEPAIREGLRVHFLGDMPPRAAQILNRYDLSEIIVTNPQMYYVASLRYMRGATAFLVIDIDLAESPFLPSKVADYFLFDKPILGLTPPDSATDRVLQSAGHATVPVNDSSAIAAAIRRLFDGWQDGRMELQDKHDTVRSSLALPVIGRQYDAILAGLRA